MTSEQIAYEIQKLRRRLKAAQSDLNQMKPAEPVEEEPQAGVPAFIGGNNDGDFALYTEDEKPISFGSTVVPSTQFNRFYLQSGDNAGIEIISYGENYINVDGVEGSTVIKSNSINGLAIESFNGTTFRNTVDDEATLIIPAGGVNDYADDTAAEAGGVPLRGVYHTSGTLKIRLV